MLEHNSIVRLSCKKHKIYSTVTQIAFLHLTIIGDALLLHMEPFDAAMSVDNIYDSYILHLTHSIIMSLYNTKFAFLNQIILFSIRFVPSLFVALPKEASMSPTI